MEDTTRIYHTDGPLRRGGTRFQIFIFEREIISAYDRYIGQSTAQYKI